MVNQYVVPFLSDKQTFHADHTGHYLVNLSRLADILRRVWAGIGKQSAEFLAGLG